MRKCNVKFNAKRSAHRASLQFDPNTQRFYKLDTVAYASRVVADKRNQFAANGLLKSLFALAGIVPDTERHGLKFQPA